MTLAGLMADAAFQLAAVFVVQRRDIQMAWPAQLQPVDSDNHVAAAEPVAAGIALEGEVLAADWAEPDSASGIGALHGVRDFGFTVFRAIHVSVEG